MRIDLKDHSVRGFIHGKIREYGEVSRNNGITMDGGRIVIMVRWRALKKS